MDTKGIRKKWGLTQSELSIVLGCSLRTVQGWDSRNTLKQWELNCIEARQREVFGWYLEEAKKWNKKYIVPFISYSWWLIKNIDKIG